MYQRIMAAIDSNYANSNVLATAIEVAVKFQAQLALCHALDDTILAQKGVPQVVFPEGMRSIEASLRSSAQEFLMAAADVALTVTDNLSLWQVTSAGTAISRLGAGLKLRRST